MRKMMDPVDDDDKDIVMEKLERILSRSLLLSRLHIWLQVRTRETL